MEESGREFRLATLPRGPLGEGQRHCAPDPVVGRQQSFLVRARLERNKIRRNGRRLFRDSSGQPEERAATSNFLQLAVCKTYLLGNLPADLWPQIGPVARLD
jgi:hypothetical protein